MVAGYHTEYSGFKFALFFLGEYVAMFSISGLGTTLFLGGWSAPFAFLQWVPSWIWFFGKVMVSMCVFIWMRGTLPRLRQDQLMNFAWKFVLPMCAAQSVCRGAVAVSWARVGCAGWSARRFWLLAYVVMGRVEMRRNTSARGVTAMRSELFVFTIRETAHRWDAAYLRTSAEKGEPVHAGLFSTFICGGLTLAWRRWRRCCSRTWCIARWRSRGLCGLALLFCSSTRSLRLRADSGLHRRGRDPGGLCHPAHARLGDCRRKASSAGLGLSGLVIAAGVFAVLGWVVLAELRAWLPQLNPRRPR